MLLLEVVSFSFVLRNIMRHNLLFFRLYFIIHFYYKKPLQFILAKALYLDSEHFDERERKSCDAVNVFYLWQTEQYIALFAHIAQYMASIILKKINLR